MKVAFLCTGIMGLPMARCLVKAGYDVAVWNRTADKLRHLADDGAEVCQSPAMAARGCDVIVVMASDSAVCDQVLFGKDGAAVAATNATSQTINRQTTNQNNDATTAAVVVVCTSATVAQAKAQAQRCAKLGLEYADAPVSGGEKGAKDGSLSVMVGASEKVYSFIHPLLSAFGKPLLMGTVGCGQLAKLANQAIVGTTIAAVAEALLLAERGGANPSAVRDALMGGFANSEILRQHGKKMLAGDIEPGGAAKYQLRDLHNALAAGEDVGLQMACTQSAALLFGEMIKAGMGEKDHSALHAFINRHCRNDDS